MSEFNVGDRVIIARPYPDEYRFLTGRTATITEASACLPEGHVRVYDNYGDVWYCLPEELDRVEDVLAPGPSEAQIRKAQPVTTGVLYYFPAALKAIAEVSRIGNEQHNPSQPLHWARGKSADHLDCAGRHLIDHGTDPIDTDGSRHLAKAAWRVLAQLQLDLEALKASR